MQLANYINDLLYRYDCVIIPNFGGFITNKIGAKFNKENQCFYPPTKQISFNSYLKHNDGLLANYIASAEKISFEDATQKIATCLIEWQNKLQKEPLEVAEIGKLFLNNNKQLVFEPATSSNFLTESFGFSTIETSVIEHFEEEAELLLLTEETDEKTSKRKVPIFIKYAATATILLSLGITGYTFFNQKENKAILAKKQQEMEQKIEQATFVIDTPLPSISLQVEKEISKNIHIIIGAFEFEENATKKVAELNKQEFKASILGKNRWGLIQVSCGSFADEQKARETLQKVKSLGFQDAWLFIE